MVNDDFEQDPVEALAAELPEPTFKTEPAVTAAEETERIGGFAFFLSLFMLLPTALLLMAVCLTAIRPIDYQALAVFGGACVFGVLLGHSAIRGHLSVLIHESKHAVVSNLVGNKRKGMKIDEGSGYFTYTYTKRTAHLNFLISLAPYILPVFTFVGALASLALFRNDHTLAALLVGLCYGTDAILNVRDISPIQTDISTIRGGYGMGIAYIFAWNLAIFAVLLTWVFNGSDGLLDLLKLATEAFMRFYSLLSPSAAPVAGSGS